MLGRPVAGRFTARFPTRSRPLRAAALRRVRGLTRNLIAHDAVDGTTGDALDGLVEAWLAQWREQLAGEAARRDGAARRRLDAAVRRAELARARATEASRTVEAVGAELRHSIALSRATDPTPTAGRQVTNGVRPVTSS